MSRSVHVTRKMLAEIMKYDFGENWRGRAEKSKAKARLEKKRRIKSSVMVERDDASDPAPPTPIDQIPIVMRDEGPFVHYPATPGDVRALMRRLPPGSCDKLQGVEFTIDRYDHDSDDDADGPIDPFIGRFRIQRYPGVYYSRALGMYNLRTMKIQLYGYVYAPDLSNRNEIELILKCRTLSCFIHELAHHQDRTTRMARGRWIMDDIQKGEDYAESWQDEWNCDYTVPFIQDTYPVEVNRLLDWLENETETRLTLPMIFGERDQRGTPRSLDINTVVDAILDRREKYEIQKELAWAFYEAKYYERALEGIERIPPDHSSDPELLVLKARVLLRLKQFDQSYDAVRRALAIDPKLDMSNFLVMLFYRQKNWPEALRNAEHVIELNRQRNETAYFPIYAVRAEAKMSMGDLDGAEAAIDEAEAVFRQSKDENERADALDGVADLRELLKDKRSETRQ